MTTSVVVGTFGDYGVWRAYAERAIASIDRQTVRPLEVLHIHDADLATARNSGAAMANGDWLIFLDADDELDPGYLEAMEKATGDIRRPATLGVTDGLEDSEACMIPRKPLLQANFIVIGAMVQRDRFLRVGGFDPALLVLEDWDLWLRMAIDGAEIVDVPDAIYRVNVRSDSRNQDQGLHHETYRRIRSKYQDKKGALA